jgi:hypothetical protein
MVASQQQRMRPVASPVRCHPSGLRVSPRSRASLARNRSTSASAARRSACAAAGVSRRSPVAGLTSRRRSPSTPGPRTRSWLVNPPSASASMGWYSPPATEVGPWEIPAQVESALDCVRGHKVSPAREGGPPWDGWSGTPLVHLQPRLERARIRHHRSLYRRTESVCLWR